MTDILDLVGRLDIGTRIRFNRTMTEPACGDHPELLYAYKGEPGTITGYGTREGYWARTDNHPVAFGVAPHEFDVEFPNVQSQRDAQALLRGSAGLTSSASDTNEAP